MLEFNLSLKLGLTRLDLRKLRTRLGLKPGEHFTLERHNVTYTPAGLEAICRHLRVPVPEVKPRKSRRPMDGQDGPQPEAAKEARGGHENLTTAGAEAAPTSPQGAEPGPDKPQTATGLSEARLVAELSTCYPGLLLASFEQPAPEGTLFLHGRPGWVRVRVQRNRDFRKGMTFAARHVADDLWELVGPCPRYPRDPRFW